MHPSMLTQADSAALTEEELNQVCWSHYMVEPTVEGAPCCSECGHQFGSPEDLLEQDTRVRREMGGTSSTFLQHPDDVFCCPFCVHDL